MRCKHHASMHGPKGKARSYRPKNSMQRARPLQPLHLELPFASVGGAVVKRGSLPSRETSNTVVQELHGKSLCTVFTIQLFTVIGFSTCDRLVA